MTAHVQPANVAFFQRLGWSRSATPATYVGCPHQPMSIDLPSGRHAALSRAGCVIAARC